MRLFNIGVLLTRKCNQSCYYCNNFKDSNVAEVDLDYLKYVLDLYYDEGVKNIQIELSGGETGLITNIIDVYKMLLNLNYVRFVNTLSNGLIRKRGFILPDILGVKFQKYEGYLEHACLEIENKNIKYFYPELTFFNAPEWVRFVVVLAENTLDALTINFDYFKKLGLFNRNIFFKSLTPKVIYPTEEFIEKSNNFIEKLSIERKEKYPLEIINFEKRNNPKLKKCCSAISKYQFIDLEYKRIGQCSMQAETCGYAEITKENLNKILNGTYFKINDFCKKCYKTHNNAFFWMLSRKRINKEYFTIE